MAMVFGMAVSCTGQGSSQEAATIIDAANKVDVYYFHNARRCATCNTVEKEAQKAIQELYDGKVPFFAYNLDESNGREKSRELGVPGQALLIVGGETVINITAEAFMFARTNPDRLKEIISEKVSTLF